MSLVYKPSLNGFGGLRGQWRLDPVPSLNSPPKERDGLAIGLIATIACLITICAHHHADAQAVHFVYCYATDGHYAVYTDVVSKPDHSFEVDALERNWINFVKNSRPALSFDDPTNSQSSACLVSGASDYLAAKTERDRAVSALMLRYHAARSFIPIIPTVGSELKITGLMLRETHGAEGIVGDGGCYRARFSDERRAIGAGRDPSSQEPGQRLPGG